MTLDWLWLLVPAVLIALTAHRRRQGTGNAGILTPRQEKDNAARLMGNHNLHP